MFYSLCIFTNILYVRFSFYIGLIYLCSYIFQFILLSFISLSFVRTFALFIYTYLSIHIYTASFILSFLRVSSLVFTPPPQFSAAVSRPFFNFPIKHHNLMNVFPARNVNPFAKMLTTNHWLHWKDCQDKWQISNEKSHSLVIPFWAREKNSF